VRERGQHHVPDRGGHLERQIRPWREKYGKELRGVGHEQDRFAATAPRWKAESRGSSRWWRLAATSPAADHRLAPDAKLELVRYYN